MKWKKEGDMKARKDEQIDNRHKFMGHTFMELRLGKLTRIGLLGWVFFVNRLNQWTKGRSDERTNEREPNDGGQKQRRAPEETDRRRMGEKTSLKRSIDFVSRSIERWRRNIWRGRNGSKGRTLTCGRTDGRNMWQGRKGSKGGTRTGGKTDEVQGVEETDQREGRGRTEHEVREERI